MTKASSWRQTAETRRLFYGDHLKAWRKYRGFTQEALGELLDVTGAQVSRIENGVRTCDLDYVIRLSTVMITDPVSLLSRDPNRP